MCDCIKEIEQKLKNNTGDSEASLDIGFVFKDNGGVLTIPNITASVRKKAKDGTFANKAKSISIIPSLCPFCGEKIDKEGL
jgi:hypothetical protein